MEKYVTNQIPCVESVSDENLLSSVQRWELFLSPPRKLNGDLHRSVFVFVYWSNGLCYLGHWFNCKETASLLAVVTLLHWATHLVFNTKLTHWGRVTHICVGKLTIIGSDNGLSPGRRQAIIWTNIAILLVVTLGTNLSEILIKVLTFSFTKMHLFESSVKWCPFCLGLNVLTWHIAYPSLMHMSFLFGWSQFQQLGMTLVEISQHARLQYLQCISNGDTAVLPEAINIRIKN